MKSAALLAALVAATLAQQWEFERVENWMGNHLQMRRAPDGALYLCYYQHDGTIRVARRDTAWHFEDIDTSVACGRGDGPSFAISPSGRPAMATLRGDEIDFVSRTDSGWVAEHTGFTGTYEGVDATLGFDSSGAPSIAWCYNGYALPGGVLFATKTESTWTTDTVFWVVPQQNYAFLCGISDFEYDASGNPHLFDLRAYGMADEDPPWTLSIGTCARLDSDWQFRHVAGGAFLQSAEALDLTTDAGCSERVCYDSGNYNGASYFNCDSALLDDHAGDAAIQVDSFGRSQVAFVVASELHFAYRTSYWHIATVPAGTDVGSCELLLDTLGQPIIAYTTSSGTWLAHGVDIVNQSEEPRGPTAYGLRPTASIVRNVLFLRPLLSAPSSLLSTDGRKVLDLHTGANDVSRLAPGVYFVVTPHLNPLPQGERGKSAAAVRKVVVTR